MNRRSAISIKTIRTLAAIALIALTAPTVSAKRIPFESRFDNSAASLWDPSFEESLDPVYLDKPYDRPSPPIIPPGRYRVYYDAEDGSLQSSLYEPQANVNATAQTTVTKLNPPSNATIPYTYAYGYTIRSADDSLQPIWNFTIRMRMEKGTPIRFDWTVPRSERWYFQRPYENRHGKNWAIWTNDQNPLKPGNEANFELRSLGLPGLLPAFMQGKPLHHNRLHKNARVPNEPGQDAVCGWVVGPVPEPANFHPIAFIEYIEQLYFKCDEVGWIESHRKVIGVLRALDRARSALESGDSQTARQAVLDGVQLIQRLSEIGGRLVREHAFTTETEGLLTANMEYLAEKLKQQGLVAARRPQFEREIDLELLAAANVDAKEVPPGLLRIYYIDYDDSIQSLLYEPRCNVDAAVKTVVHRLEQTDDPSIRYAYSYEISSGVSSLQSIRGFRIHMTLDRNAPTTLVSPEKLGWSRSTPKPRITATNRASWTDLSRPERAIMPGETQGGFQLRSSGLPGILEAYIVGSLTEAYGLNENIVFPKGRTGEWAAGYIVGPVPEPSPFEAGAFLEAVVRLFRRCREIGWAAPLTADKAVESLQQARTLLAAGEVQAARKRLEAVVEIVHREGGEERFYTTEASGMLTANLEYLLERL